MANVLEYIKTIWKAGREGGTAWTPARLNNIEGGIEQATQQINTNSADIETIGKEIGEINSNLNKNNGEIRIAFIFPYVNNNEMTSNYVYMGHKNITLIAIYNSSYAEITSRVTFNCNNGFISLYSADSDFIKSYKGQRVLVSIKIS